MLNSGSFQKERESRFPWEARQSVDPSQGRSSLRDFRDINIYIYIEGSSVSVRQDGSGPEGSDSHSAGMYPRLR